jgi:hypothetical protein
MELQDSILKAIDAITKTRIDKLQLDKTVTAEIIKCTNALSREYKCSYNGGNITAYAAEGATYTNGQSVYVLIPQSDMTKRKTIVGVSSAKEDDENISFVSSALSDYNLIGKNVINDKKNIQPVGLHSYKKEEYFLLYDYATRNDSSRNYVNIEIEELNNNLKQAEALMIEASFQTRLPKAHKLSQDGVYGLQFVLAFADRDKTDENGKPAIKYISYVIDSNNMTGNPFRFSSWSEQYQIYPIDIENFLYIDSILFYEKDFIEKDNINMANSWGADIFLKDIEVYPLKKIDAVSGNYKLSLSMPQGSTFRGNTSEDQLDIVAKVTEKNINNLSDNTTFYWFKEDNRVISDSDNYQMYGGAGWAWLKNKGNNYTLYTDATENRAYENKYLCVAVYKESVILKTYFVIYNESARRDITISSSLGAKFSFDRGKPVLTCMIDGKSEKFEEGKPNSHADSLFRFIWSKIDEYNNTTTFIETYAELEKKYEELKKTPGVSYHDLSALKNQMLALQGVSWERNVLNYPISQIDNNAKFKCSVYLKDTPDGEEYSIGSAEILLQNENAASPTDYYITIENGDQVFQYSESGVSPDDERYTDPLVVKPLICHFFDPAGLEVNKETYDVKWVVPLENSMIVVPTKSMIMNNANNKIEWYIEEIFPLEIANDYDYQALNNQVTAIVSYKDQEYKQDTTLLFTKIGENGTNGTDIVAKISPRLKTANNELLAIVTGKGDAYYNDIASTPLTSQTNLPLQFDLYQRNTKLALDKKPKWSIAGASNQSKFLYNPDTQTSQLGWSQEKTERKFRYQIVKADIEYENNNYYAFYPMPVIEYNNAGNLHIGLDKTTTLKSITYNADGRNPLYNKNQFIELNISGNKEYYIVWTAEGGEPRVANRTTKVYESNPRNAAFTLLLDNKEKEGSSIIVPAENNVNKVYILPDNIYTGEYTNNLVHAAIYTSKEIYQNGGNTICDVYVPIYMSLNVYGLKSLNAWDGNHVEINEDENYVLAPQIGAGKKDTNNKFTGILMGTSQTYDQKEEQVGLLGYSKGKQSIWLDADSGNAIFGLPEQQASANNNFTEGRIELIPGGESKIGQWRIGSRAMYNMTIPDVEGDSFTGVEPIKPYSDYAVKGAQIAIPQEAQGIILNANPAYASYKGKPLFKTNSKIDFDNANAAIREGDSFEVEIDPSKDSAFSIYRHTKWDKGVLTNDWHRYPLVGINAQGQFYTNAIENEESSMGIGKIGAFGTAAADGKYVGAQFGYDNTNLFKFFILKDGEEGTISRTLFLTAGTNKTNEYSRPLSMNFKSINLYASNSSDSQISDYRMNLSTNGLSLGQKDKTFLDLTFTNNSAEYNRLNTQTNLAITVPKNRHFSLNNHNNGTPLLDINEGNAKITLSGALTTRTDQEVDLDSKTKAHLGSKYFDFSLDYSTGVGQLASDNGSALTINRDGNTNSSLVDNCGISLTAKQQGGIQLISENANKGIKIDARLNNNSATSTYMTFTPNGQGFSTFSITSGCGNIWSEKGGVSGYDGLKLSAFAAPWAIFPSVKPGTNRSIEAANDIFSNRNIQGNELYWINNKRDSHNWGTNSNNVWAHLDAIYGIIRNLRTDIDDTRKNYATKDWVKRDFALANHNHTGVYASAKHKHNYTAYNGVSSTYAVSSLNTAKITYGLGGSGPNYVVTGGDKAIVVTGVKTKSQETSGPV